MLKKMLLNTCLMSICISIQAQDKNIVFLNQFIKSYLGHSYFLKQQYSIYKESQGRKLIIQSMDDLNLNARVGYNYLSYKNFNKDLNQLKVGIGLSEHFSGSGTTLSLEDSIGLGTINKKSALGNSLTLSVVQPVLKNFFGFLDRIAIKQAGLEVQSNKMLYQESIETTIIDAITLYLQWVGLYKERSILKSIIKNNQTVFNQTAAQLRAGIVEVSDLEIARSSVIQYQKKLLINQNNLNKVVLTLSDYMPIKKNDIPDLEILNNTPDVINTSINPKFIRSIQSLNYLLDIASLSVKAAKNQYLPALDLVASYQYNAYNNDSLASFYPSEHNLFVGAQINVPLFFMNARGLAQESRAQYDNILAQKNNATESIIRDVKSLQYETIIFQEQLEQERELVKSLGRQVKSQRRQYKRGTLDLDNLIRGLNDEANAQLEMNSLKIEFNQSYNLYLQLTDQLMSHYKNDIPENILLV